MESVPENRPEKLEKIVSAALNVDGEIFTGENHGIAFNKYLEKYPDADYEEAEVFIEGYVTSADRFVDRSEAAEIAHKAKQITDTPTDKEGNALQPWEEGFDLDVYDLRSENEESE